MIIPIIRIQGVPPPPGVHLFLKPETPMTARHSSTTKVNSPKNRARYNSVVQVDHGLKYLNKVPLI